MVFFSDLEAPHAAALARVKSANHQQEAALVLDSVTFLPDGMDQQDGPLLKIGGFIALAAGAVLSLIAFDAAQSEPWMKFVGPPLLALGGGVFWYGQKVKNDAQNRPRTTGLYLVEDALLHVTTERSFVFPRECVRTFEYREKIISESAHHTLYLHYADEDGAAEEHLLGHADRLAPLKAWHEGAGQSASSGPEVSPHARLPKREQPNE